MAAIGRLTRLAMDEARDRGCGMGQTRRVWGEPREYPVGLLFQRVGLFSPGTWSWGPRVTSPSCRCQVERGAKDPWPLPEEGSWC